MPVALAQGEPPSQPALAKEVSLDRTVMTHLLDDLEAHDLVVRRPGPRDRRARQVVLTDTGRAHLAEVRQGLAAAEARLLVGLADEDAEQLRGLLGRVAQTAQRELVAPDEMKCRPPPGPAEPLRAGRPMRAPPVRATLDTATPRTTARKGDGHASARRRSTRH